MSEVWMVRNSDTDIHLFNRYEHLGPSVKISYSQCSFVNIEEKRDPRKTTFTVTGKRNGENFKETVIAHQYPVWTEPSHL
jgi:hypothetical protein